MSMSACLCVWMDGWMDGMFRRGKQDAEKGVLFTELPPVLTIHLKRFEFDMQRMVSLRHLHGVMHS